MTSHPIYTLTFWCPDRIGIVHAVAKQLVRNGCNIIDSSQFTDEETARFFMRVSFQGADGCNLATLSAGFERIAAAFGMEWTLYDRGVRPRVLLMVSKFDHCLLDLMYRHSIGELPIEIPVVVSNHPDVAAIAARHEIPFLHFPVTPDTKRQQEQALGDVIERHRIELVVLARYMQVLSADFCARLPHRVINIHHSFLPSFKGARPYHQAHARGVKLIGATAHFVTADLDEGPIIEQDVARVRHDMSTGELVAIGRDIERLVLARAVKLYAERRILMNGVKTIVFN